MSITSSAGSDQRTPSSQGDGGTLSSNLALTSYQKGSKDKSEDYRIRFEVLEPTDQRNLDVLNDALNQIEHPGVFCDGPHCNNSDACIKGTRYKCALCDNVDFCSACICAFANQHDGRHKMIRCKVPTICKVIKEFDDESRRALLSNDPTARDTDLLHAVVTETIRSTVEPTSQQLVFEGTPRTVFAIIKDTDPRPDDAKRKTNIIELDSRPEQGDYVIGYRIDEAANVTLTHQPFNADRRVARESVVQHGDSTTIMEVAVGRMKPFNYTSRTEFYDSVRAGHLVTRVLDLQPGEDEDRLEVDFRIVDLAEGANYESLSYTWKETAFARAHNKIWDKETSNTFSNMMDFRHPVHRGQEFFKVGVGLRDALRSLRHESKTQTYWVDQISINQDDLNERAFQVRNMASIYNRAMRTVVWVGDEDKDSVIAVRLIQALSVARQRFPALIRFPDKLQAETDLDLPPVDSQQWLSLFRFFSRPIYERMWVIQEIVVARDVVIRCGPARLSWDDICLTAMLLCSPPWAWLLRKLGIRQDEFLSGTNRIAHIVHVMGFRTDFHALRELSMERLLYSTSKFEASDSRDKVYACLGLRTAKNTWEGNDLRPRYDISTQECFTEVAKYALAKERSFALCGINTTISRKTLPDLPSWVPDLGLTNHTCQFALSRPDPPPPYKAAGNSEILAVFPYDSHPNLLVTSSAKIGTIMHLSKRKFSNTDHESQGPKLGEWASLCAKYCGQAYRIGEFSPDAFWRTLVADSTTTWRSSPAPDSYHIPLARFISNMVIQYLNEKYSKAILSEMMATGSGEVGEMLNPVIARLGRDSIERDKASPETETLYAAEDAETEVGVGALIRDEACGALSTTCHDRKFFVTDGHHIGIGPSDAEIGDEVHILAGGNVPFVLRKVKKRGEQEVEELTAGETHETTLPEDLEEDMQVYRMLGETYVHGVMKGEALKLEGFEWSGIGIL